MWWLIGGILIVVVGIDAWLDLRKLRIGVGLVFIGTWVVFTLIGFASSAFADDDMALALILLAALALGLFSALLLGLFNVANGVTMMRRESHRFVNLLSLVFGVTVVAAVVYVIAGLALDSVNRDVAFEMFRWLLFASLPIGYLALVFVSFLAQSTLYGWLVSRLSRKADAVIVLGAGLSDGKVTPLLAARLDRGKSVFARLTSPNAVLIVSGGQGSDEPVSEAQAMSDYLLASGVDSSRLLMEDQSTTTEQNLEFSRRLLCERGLENARCLVVTNNYHAMRAAFLMRKLGVAGHAVGASTARYFWPSAFLREYLAILRDHTVLNVLMLGFASLPFIVFLVSGLV